MKSNIRLKTVTALSVLLSTCPVFSQNDTVRIRDTQVIHDTVVKHDVAPAQPADRDEPGLLRGEFGIRYMPTFHSLRLRNYNNEVVGTELSMSHGWGAFIGFNFNSHVGVVAEINYLQVNQKFKDQALQRSVSLSYLNFPVLLSLNTNKMAPVNVNFVIGPQFGLNVGSSVNTTGTGNADVVQATVAAKAGDAGMAYGVGAEIGLNKEHTLRLDVGFRGYYGLIDVSAGQTSSNPDTYNVLLKAARKSYAGYIGLAYMF
jgi:hypothetical protein